MELLEVLIESAPDMACSLILILVWREYVNMKRMNGKKGENDDD